MLRSFLKNTAGSYGITMGMLSIPLLLSMGLAVDYSRYVSAESHLQELADGTSLTLAASREKDEAKLQKMAEEFVASNVGKSKFDNVVVANLKTIDNKIDLELKARIGTYFMGLVNIDTLDVEASALAERAVTGAVEMVMVLDNTWSMSEVDDAGVSKIATLKTAASSLASELLSNNEAVVRVGLVPYGDYVNVGTAYRNESWLSVPADYTVTPAPKVCETKMVSVTPCEQNAPKYACTKYVDGVPEAATCGGQCTKNGTPTMVEKQVCTGGGSATNYKWYGCVGSRMTGTTRLTDGSPTTKYPGYVETSQKCLNPIVPLTTDKNTVLAAINGMVINIGSYKPYTYIPAGLIWGQNLLSDSKPFTEAAAYDPDNITPRKVAVLMTDGDNTLQFRASDGRHVALSSSAATAVTQVAKTNNDTKAICDYMKTNKIEIYTVAFMVDNADAKTLLQNCATDPEHYYDASDSEKLMSAFSGIAQSLSQVRLAR